jgi:hypothetical protein
MGGLCERLRLGRFNKLLPDPDDDDDDDEDDAVDDASDAVDDAEIEAVSDDDEEILEEVGTMVDGDMAGVGTRQAAGEAEAVTCT